MRTTAARKVAAAREMTPGPARKVTAATTAVAAAPARRVTAAAATPVAAAPAAVRLGQRGRRACEDRSQNADCQKKASALGTHDCHLPLPFAPLREY
jgi:hypothetical protein